MCDHYTNISKFLTHQKSIDVVFVGEHKIFLGMLKSSTSRCCYGPTPKEDSIQRRMFVYSYLNPIDSRIHNIWSFLSNKCTQHEKTKNVIYAIFIP
jgi:hypothetical protein